MRIALLSDIHANGFALDAVLHRAAGEGVDAYWFLGDAVGYGPHPAAGLEFWRSLPPGHTVPGNHDAGILGLLGTSFFNESAVEALRINREELEMHHPDLLQYFRESFLDESQWIQRKTLDNNLFLLVHGSLWRADGAFEHIIFYAWSWVRKIVIKELMMLADQKDITTGKACIVSGHTHIPCFCHLDGARNGESEIIHPGIRWGEALPISSHPTLINPGSVGQPRDGDPRASFAVLDADAMTITYHRVEYPIRKTQRDMHRLGMPSFLRERLQNANRPDDWPVGWRV